MCLRTLCMVAVLLSANTAAAAELLAKVSSSKSAPVELTLEMQSDGGVAGFSLAVYVGEVDAKSLRTAECVARLPPGFTAGCAYSRGHIRIIASADVPGTFMPKGVAEIGSVTINSPIAKAGEIQVLKFETSNDLGHSSAGTSRVRGDGAGDETDLNAQR